MSQGMNQQFQHTQALTGIRIADFDLFLFDFDGVLVNTDFLLYKSAVNTFAECGFDLSPVFTFQDFLKAVYCKEWRKALKILVEKHLSISMNDFSTKKHKAYMSLLSSGPELSLLPGVAPLLKALSQRKATMCVVTRSTQKETAIIRRRLPELNLVSYWFTRERVLHSKPDPEGYNLAIDEMAQVGDRIVGFEDTLEGLEALQNTRVPCTAVFVSPFSFPSHPALTRPRTSRLCSLSDVILT